MDTYLATVERTTDETGHEARKSTPRKHSWWPTHPDSSIIHHGFIGCCYYDANEPEDVARCRSGYPGSKPWPAKEHLLAPASPRTTAEEYDKGACGYQYYGRGGQSWAIPYCAGVLALGWQVRPELTPQQMRELLFASAYVTKDGAKIISPPAFIKQVRQTPKRF